MTPNILKMLSSAKLKSTSMIQGTLYIRNAIYVMRAPQKKLNIIFLQWGP